MATKSKQQKAIQLTTGVVCGVAFYTSMNHVHQSVNDIPYIYPLLTLLCITFAICYGIHQYERKKRHKHFRITLKNLHRVQPLGYGLIFYFSSAYIIDLIWGMQPTMYTYAYPSLHVTITSWWYAMHVLIIIPIMETIISVYIVRDTLTKKTPHMIWFIPLLMSIVPLLSIVDSASIHHMTHVFMMTYIAHITYIYTYYKTQNIWYSICSHFIINSTTYGYLVWQYVM